jgi:Fe-S-cluster-containing dehydrogenase component
MCYDRTSVGLKPMCATVCPSGALFFGTPEELAEQRSGTPVNEFIFGEQIVHTKVRVMMPAGSKKLVVSSGVSIRKSDLLQNTRKAETPHG